MTVEDGSWNGKDRRAKEQDPEEAGWTRIAAMVKSSIREVLAEELENDDDDDEGDEDDDDEGTSGRRSGGTSTRPPARRGAPAPKAGKGKPAPKKEATSSGIIALLLGSTRPKR
ncbi:MAG: hypothetical protein ACYDAY_11955 [Candidatus Dormibacteria bacterium]